MFLRWARKRNGPVAFRDGQKVRNLVAAGKTVTLYAVWAKKSYRIAFSAGGGKGAMAVLTVRFGRTARLPACAFRRKGYRFAGWAKSAALAAEGVVAFRDGQAVRDLVKNGGTVVLHAVWEEKRKSGRGITSTIRPRR